MHLLSDMGRTESQLRTKLKQGGYAEDAVEAAIRYVKSFGYINDVEYARSFIDSRKERKSKKRTLCGTCKKGVSSEIVEQVFEETDYGEERFQTGDRGTDAEREVITRKQRMRRKTENDGLSDA